MAPGSSASASRPPAARRERGSCAQLLGLLEEFTPVVEALPPDAALADVRGALRYFGRDAAGLAALVRVRALALHGVDCAIGAAAEPAARPDGRRGSRARERPGWCPMTPVAVAEFLAGRPVAALHGVGAGDRPHPVRVRARHRRQGRRRAARPRCSGSSARATGRELHERARGIDRRRSSRTPPPARWPPNAPSPATNWTRTGTAARCSRSPTNSGARLRADGQVCRALTLTVRYADRSATTRTRTLEEPTAHSPALTATAYAPARRARAAAGPGPVRSRCAPRG